MMEDTEWHAWFRNHTLYSAWTGNEVGEEMFAISPGWRKLVIDLMDKLFAVGWDGHIAQVKEKFGGLRFYAGGLTNEQDNIIHDAEAKSFTICETCGNPGRPRGGGWITTLCDDHC